MDLVDHYVSHFVRHFAPTKSVPFWFISIWSAVTKLQNKLTHAENELSCLLRKTVTERDNEPVRTCAITLPTAETKLCKQPPPTTIRINTTQRDGYIPQMHAPGQIKIYFVDEDYTTFCPKHSYESTVVPMGHSRTQSLQCPHQGITVKQLRHFVVL